MLNFKKLIETNLFLFFVGKFVGCKLDGLPPSVRRRPSSHPQPRSQGLESSRTPGMFLRSFGSFSVRIFSCHSVWGFRICCFWLKFNCGNILASCNTSPRIILNHITSHQTISIHIVSSGYASKFRSPKDSNKLTTLKFIHVFHCVSLFLYLADPYKI